MICAKQQNNSIQFLSGVLVTQKYNLIVEATRLLANYDASSRVLKYQRCHQNWTKPREMYDIIEENVFVR